MRNVAHIDVVKGTTETWNLTKLVPLPFGICAFIRNIYKKEKYDLWNHLWKTKNLEESFQKNSTIFFT